MKEGGGWSGEEWGGEGGRSMGMGLGTHTHIHTHIDDHDDNDDEDQHDHDTGRAGQHRCGVCAFGWWGLESSIDSLFAQAAATTS